ncbi:MAG: hypothetical protein J6A62_05045 [Oscillospiraceae bacterium]|nr:hypothetical protein [Oscillospiraceae bacterium]
MSLLEPRCLCPGGELSKAGEDCRQAARVAQFRVSQQAFYLPAFPGWQYVPFRKLTGIVLRNASLPTTGCCGKELPVLKLTLRWETGEREMILDPPKHADGILEKICAARPDLAADDRR